MPPSGPLRIPRGIQLGCRKCHRPARSFQARVSAATTPEQSATASCRNRVRVEVARDLPLEFAGPELSQCQSHREVHPTAIRHAAPGDHLRYCISTSQLICPKGCAQPAFASLFKTAVDRSAASSCLRNIKRFGIPSQRKGQKQHARRDETDKNLPQIRTLVLAKLLPDGDPLASAAAVVALCRPARRKFDVQPQAGLREWLGSS